jgi:hypothetical protein
MKPDNGNPGLLEPRLCAVDEADAYDAGSETSSVRRNPRARQTSPNSESAPVRSTTRVRGV